MGYDKPRKLGDRETGGGLSLPIWITFMETALKSTPVTEIPVPAGVVNVAGEWFYDEFARGAGVSSLGIEGRPSGLPVDAGNPPLPGAAPPVQVMPAADERRRILDLFKN
jgi:penicillin-binding protein 1A